jgi:hypothetical protein
MNVSAGETVNFTMTVPLGVGSGSLNSKKSPSWQTSELILSSVLSVSEYRTALTSVTKHFPG